MKKREIGKLLATHRKDSGLSQKQLAKKLGYEASQVVSSVERDECDLPPRKARMWLKLIKADKEFVCNYYIKRYTKNIRKVYGL